ncbi:hypothetical protein ACQCVE_06750 [Metabacillus sp. 113a]|uniref:hypothetical protein n=1 Tax=Metabacillus sp. 113a TaxID=3404706 RepID=UPI003CF63219
MTEKDIWKWLLPKFTNDLLYDIYQEQKVVCNGFRASNIKDKNSNRKLFITNLLNKGNFNKLVKWSREKVPESLLTEEQVDTLELEELTEAASKHSPMKVLLKLLSENHDKKAIQFFTYLKEEEIEILEEPMFEDPAVPKEVEKQIETEPQGEGNQKNIEKIEKKLDRKIKKLQEELTKRDTQYKTKVDELVKNNQNLQKKLNEKSQELGEINYYCEELKKQNQEEKAIWEEERKQLKEIIQNLELQGEAKEEIPEVERVEDIPIQILVIGKPMYTNQFKSKKINFNFVQGNDVLHYDFSEPYDAYWVLMYELSVKQQVWFNANVTRSNIDLSKVTFCKDFTEVKNHINLHTQHEERV